MARAHAPVRRGGRLFLLLGILIVVAAALVYFVLSGGSADRSVPPRAAFLLAPGKTATVTWYGNNYRLRYQRSGQVDVSNCETSGTTDPVDVACGPAAEVIFRIDNLYGHKPGEPLRVENGARYAQISP